MNQKNLKDLDNLTVKGPLSEVDKKLILAFANMIEAQAKMIRTVVNYEDLEPILDDETEYDALIARFQTDEFNGSQLLEDQ